MWKGKGLEEIRPNVEVEALDRMKEGTRREIRVKHREEE